VRELATLHRRTGFILLLCVLLVGARISGAHWHLCLDRTEPPLAMHVGDIGLHDDGVSSDTPHQDIDLELVDDGILKNVNAELHAPMLLALIVCLWLLPLRARPILNSAYRIPLFLNDPRSLHAPPRAPPL